MYALLFVLVLSAQPHAAQDPSLTPEAEAAVTAVRTAVADARQRLDKAGPPESVAGELYRRVALEQAGRRAMAAMNRLPLEQQRIAYPQAWSVISPIDDDNTAWLKRHLPRDGWFRISRDGVQATQNAFLIVQHSGDQMWMKQILARMEPLAKAGEVRGSNYALLYDRTALADGQPQRYGSQLGCDVGKLGFRRMEDPAGVNARRKAVGLTDGLAEYAKHFPTFGQPC